MMEWSYIFKSSKMCFRFRKQAKTQNQGQVSFERTTLAKFCVSPKTYAQNQGWVFFFFLWEGHINGLWIIKWPHLLKLKVFSLDSSAIAYFEIFRGSRMPHRTVQQPPVCIPLLKMYCTQMSRPNLDIEIAS